MSLQSSNPANLGFDFEAACEETPSIPEPAASQTGSPAMLAGTPIASKFTAKVIQESGRQSENPEPQLPRLGRGKLCYKHPVTGRFIRVPDNLILRPCSPPSPASLLKSHRSQLQAHAHMTSPSLLSSSDLRNLSPSIPSQRHGVMGPPPPGPLDMYTNRPIALRNATPAVGSTFNKSTKRKAGADEDTNSGRSDYRGSHSEWSSPLRSQPTFLHPDWQPSVETQRLEEDTQTETDQPDACLSTNNKRMRKIRNREAVDETRRVEGQWRKKEQAALAEAKEYKRKELEALARASFYRRRRNEAQESM